MTPTLLDYSRRPELGLHARVVADVLAAAAPLGVLPLIVGAFARDLLLMHAHGIDTRRQTEDLDFALAVDDWQTFDALRSRLLAADAFAPVGSASHALRHKSGWRVDLVPFGRLETLERTITWPPRGDVVMDVFGFKEAVSSAHPVVLPDAVQTRVVSLPALALLKLVCWKDRHTTSPRKDAHDLQLIVRSYLAAGNESRLWDEFTPWTQEDDFDYERAGARMLGHDMGALLDAAGKQRIVTLLTEQASADLPAVLPAQMNTQDPDAARRLLAAVLTGLTEEATR
jgi:predicted nucleotidyltransferase